MTRIKAKRKAADKIKVLLREQKTKTIWTNKPDAQDNCA
ncbi:hypothetical protein CTRC46_04105 [Chlamydia trachomatis RC-L2(s)/46]|nr:hypothetical protein G11222_04115 [Chlamydia trachomatis G/11222]AGJ64233.1 hypothetical protein CTLINITIAL_00760 [Chlamydia trachomatis L2/434/Bu(i)]AGJ65173.1 hypothetical protein CTLFINAL_00760 [Chlamydia trachomatis L2/434/Bu(f)]AGR95146.1 hypothetical protein CTRC46_04105 [Chlamydia trachomatis RC-L2(s)/46]AGR97025.1 hypothetical protein CTRC943_04090 [Chlamydia trachomatis RC-J/943]AGR98865.1 hypothetical protein CTRC3_04135 [Chlamydia trachomatis RC-L2(s)/3]AGS01677.1 hypothetical p